MNSGPLSLQMRESLLAARRKAMSMGSQEALALVVVPPGTSPIDAAAIHNLSAEILYVDGRYDDALSVFSAKIEPLFEQLPDTMRVELLDNKCMVLRAAWDLEFARLNSQLVDRRVTLDHPVRDFRRIVQATRAAAQGKHRDALADYWSELRQARASMSWRRRLLAHGDFARECLALGWYTFAAFHGALSGDPHTLERLCDTLVGLNDGGVVGSVVRHLLSVTRLRLHATHAAQVLPRLADLLPDADLPPVVDHLADWAAKPWDSPISDTLGKRAWEALGVLARRFETAMAIRVLQVGLDHPGIAQPGDSRGALLGAVSVLLQRVPPEVAAAAAHRLLPAVTDLKHDIDYAQAINALCHAVRRAASPEATRSIADRLYPSGQAVGSTYLLQAAPVFGLKPLDPIEFNETACRYAADIRKQVEWLADGQEPSRLGGFGTMRTSIDGKSLVVHMSGGQHWLDSVIANKATLDQPSADTLATALTDMALHDDNSISNRCGLLATLSELTERLSEPAAAQCAQRLRSIGAGIIKESRVSMSHAEAKNPLNPIQIDHGDPALLQGSALVTIAELASGTKAAIEALREDDLLVAAMADPRPIVRAHAGLAASRMQSLNQGEVNSLFLLCTDPDSQTVRAALSAFADADRLGLTRTQLGLLLTVLERAALRNDAAIRCRAALAASSLTDATLNAKLRARRDGLLQRLAADPASSVRNAVGAQPRA